MKLVPLFNNHTTLFQVWTWSIHPWNISICGSLFLIPFDAVSSELLLV